MDTNRIEWIDVAKGIGIMLVILGHTIDLNYSSIIYTFHMPLFFLLSGLFAKHYDCFKTAVKKRTHTILIPWMNLYIISLFVVLIIPEWRTELNVNGLLMELYTTNTNLIQNSSLWYLVCFFFVTLFFQIMSSFKLAPLNKKKVMVLIVIILALLYMKSLLNLLPIPEHRLPFKIDTALVSLVFFAFGFYAKELLFSIVLKFRIWHLLALFIVWFIAAFLNGWTNLNSFDFGRFKLLFYPIAGCGIIVTMRAAKIIASEKKFSNISKLLMFYGKNSLIIYGFQSLLIRLYYLCFNHLCDLNLKLYADNPIIHQIGSFFVVTFILSPLVVLAFNKFKIVGYKIL